jgi:ribosomal protein S18 acetylase RimI-like enzyme
VTSTREATSDDVSAVLDLWKRAESSPSVTDTAEDLERAIAQPAAAVLVATDDGAVIGSLIVTFDGWRGNVYRMAVDPVVRRQGIARDLFRAGEEWLRARGAKRVTALVEDDRPIAQAFWGAVGFEHQQHMRRYVKSQ